MAPAALRTLRSHLGSLVLVLAFATANAQPASLTIDVREPFDKVGGYTYVEATMHGSAERDDGSFGEYSVPLILIYPSDGGNGVGVVDWSNSAFYQAFGHDDPDEFTTLQWARLATDGYLFEQGYTYASVQWSKEVTELFGPDPPDEGEYNHLVYGTIDAGTDTWQILRDAARFLRDPSSFAGAGGPEPVDTVVSFGFSQTGNLQMGFLVGGENVVDGERAYDAHLVGAAGTFCREPTDEPPFFFAQTRCEAAPVHDGSKMMLLATQSDVETPFAAALARYPDRDDWRQYELAGVAHLPSTSFPGLAENQNPVDFRPAFRAAFHNLKRWTTADTEPPPSAFLDGDVITDGPADAIGILQTAVDEDGNALGGLRLPHMEQDVGGEVAGAPLGTYAGVNMDTEFPDVFSDVFIMVGGTFEPFGDDELRARYPDHETYVDRVRRAAEHLYETGYILEADRDAYVREAEASRIGR